jgi:P4 family phage/plasmid primase-like protien
MPLGRVREPGSDDNDTTPSIGLVEQRREELERGDHVELAGRLATEFRAQGPTTFTDGRFYRYVPARGIYEWVNQSELSTIVQAFAGTRVKGSKHPLRLRANDVAGIIKLTADQMHDPEFFSCATRGVAFADCFVEVTAEQITPRHHSPCHRARYAYPFPFAGDSEPTRLLKFFSEVFRDNPDAGQKVALVQEYLGASLLGLATKYQRALVSVGDGSNGKGVAHQIAEACMPRGSVCAIPPQDMGNEYRRALLAGKLLNIVSELPESDILDSESWKALIAGDATTAREIRQAPFTFRPIAGHMYSANRLPGTTDQSHGFWRRILIISFLRIFTEEEQNPNLAGEITAEELPAIVAWILRGAQRLLATTTYTVPASARAVLDRWRVQADQVRAFVDERCAKLAPDAPVRDGEAAEHLYRAYRWWASDNGHRPLASNTFGERMRLLGLASRSDGTSRRYPVELHAGGADAR